ncbi:uncharacterized protein SETTUDRAFT_23689 [Exserohilum turcica Et28A]|uniref:Uncharacterized protein n=1 Tax=Exserohilum turcicum (strain 28A) TaxID=671987 RepID=R0JIY5_EXST2|nr:uncharacterized protein SETTUDRAFT_23689 [Exserohilum turcica Et28A]EOA81308.1 hypothetical protein SETTUDRAFT_23689 [Exserohilum turcica Et28A]
MAQFGISNMLLCSENALNEKAGSKRRPQLEPSSWICVLEVWIIMRQLVEHRCDQFHGTYSSYLHSTAQYRRSGPDPIAR